MYHLEQFERYRDQVERSTDRQGVNLFRKRKAHEPCDVMISFVRSFMTLPAAILM